MSRSPVPALENLSLQAGRHEPTHSIEPEPSSATTTASTSSLLGASTSITDDETHAHDIGSVLYPTVRVSVQEAPGRVPTASASSNAPLATTMPGPHLPGTWRSSYRDPEVHRYEHPGHRYAPGNPGGPEWLRSAWNPGNRYSTLLTAMEAAASNIPECDVHRERRNSQRTIAPQGFTGMFQMNTVFCIQILM